MRVAGSLALAVALFAVGCGTQGTSAPKAKAQPGAKGSVSVLYAGSLVNMMEHDLGPSFSRATGYRFQGYGAGSKAVANEIKGKLRRADVFISASPKVNALLEGKANGDWVGWYATFATAPLVIGYNPKSRFAQQLKTKPWYKVLAAPGFRLGRTDPKLDPKGALTVEFVGKAASYYGKPGLVQKILGQDENPAQVFPEEDLIGRLQSGQLDAGFFYANEAAEANIPTIQLLPAIDPQATYTVTIVSGAPDPQGAFSFVRFLLGPKGQQILHSHGLTTPAPKLSGSPAAVPKGLTSLLGE